MPLETSIAEQPTDAIRGRRRTRLDDVVAYFHTGGTTGVPKLAQHTQRMRVVHALSTAYVTDHDEDDVKLLGPSLFPVAGSVIMGEISLLAGVRLALCSPSGFRERAVVQNLLRIIEPEGVTCFFGVPMALSAVANAPVGDPDLASLRAIWTGGAAAPIELLKTVSEMTGLRVIESFGMTEIGSISLFQRPEAPCTLGSLGIRCPYMEVKIGVQQPDGDVVGEAAPGEICTLCFRGPVVMQGYVGGRAQAETFTADG